MYEGRAQGKLKVDRSTMDATSEQQVEAAVQHKSSIEITDAMARGKLSPKDSESIQGTAAPSPHDLNGVTVP